MFGFLKPITTFHNDSIIVKFCSIVKFWCSDIDAPSSKWCTKYIQFYQQRNGKRNFQNNETNYESWVIKPWKIRLMYLGGTSMKICYYLVTLSQNNYKNYIITTRENSIKTTIVCLFFRFNHWKIFFFWFNHWDFAFVFKQLHKNMNSIKTTIVWNLVGLTMWNFFMI